MLATLFVLLVSTVAFAAWSMTLPSRERPLVWAGYAAHVFSAFAMLWIIIEVYNGIGDALTYLREGEMLAAYIRLDPVDHGADVISLIFHGRPDFPFVVFGVGRSTGTMAGIASLLMLGLGSSWAASLAMSLISYAGQLCLYMALRPWLPRAFRMRLALGVLLLPSVVFWTSGLQKEALMMCGVGLTTLGLTKLAHGRALRAGPMVVVGLVMIGVVKPYVFFPAAAALGVFLYWRRATAGGQGVKIRPGALIAAAALSLVLIVALSRLFPAYSVENLADTAAAQQEHGRSVGGGSFVDTGNPEDRSLVGQVSYAPMALVSSLFRPFLFEVSNAMMLVNALETTALTLLLFFALARLKPKGVWDRIMGSPFLAAATVFVLVLGTGVGLGTTNLGTLSRYRIPMMPFFALVLLGLTYRMRVSARLRGAQPRR